MQTQHFLKLYLTYTYALDTGQVVICKYYSLLTKILKVNH